MLNIEKYKDNIINSDQTDITCCANKLFHNGVCPDNCKDCKKAVMKWLLDEYKEPILDDAEKEYLSAVIKPFRKKISCIRKTKDPRKCENYIKIECCDGDLMHFPNLSNDAMYKGMKLDRKYTLEELGL